MKTKLIKHDAISTFELSLNAFIKDKEIIDIKYQMNSCLSSNNKIASMYSALVLYRDVTIKDDYYKDE